MGWDMILSSLKKQNPMIIVKLEVEAGDESIFDMEDWCKENTKSFINMDLGRGQKEYFALFYFFEKNDASLFKLTWG